MFSIYIVVSIPVRLRQCYCAGLVFPWKMYLKFLMITKIPLASSIKILVTELINYDNYLVSCQTICSICNVLTFTYCQGPIKLPSNNVNSEKPLVGKIPKDFIALFGGSIEIWKYLTFHFTDMKYSCRFVSWVHRQLAVRRTGDRLLLLLNRWKHESEERAIRQSDEVEIFTTF